MRKKTAILEGDSVFLRLVSIFSCHLQGGRVRYRFPSRNAILRPDSQYWHCSLPVAVSRAPPIGRSQATHSQS